MILEDTKSDVTINGNFETNGFKILASAKAFDMLSSKIYKYPIKAVIRELACNALDSQILNNNPIQKFDVHLPNVFEPYFSIRDYGVGLSHEECTNLYTTYFHSTKTYSNEYTGCLGVGSKSPLSISDSFTVSSFYNGYVNTYSAYKDEDGCPQFAHLSKESTNEPNGLLVTVQVNKYDFIAFENYAIDVFKYFEIVPEINSKRVIENIQDWKDLVEISEDTFQVRAGNNISLVMGSIAYPYKDRCWNLSDKDITIFFELGELNFTPGREELALSNQQNDKVKERLDDIYKVLTKTIQDEVDLCTNSFDANIIAKRYPKFNLVYKNKNLPVHIYSKERFFRYSISGRKKSNSDTILYNNSAYFNDKPKMGKRILTYLESNNITHGYLLTDEQIALFEIPIDLIIDPETLPKPVTTKYSRKTINVFKYSNTWKPHKLEDSEIDGLYLPLMRLKPNTGNLHINQNLREVLQSIKDYLDVPFVYGFNNAFMSSKRFRKGNYVRLDEFIKNELWKKLPKIREISSRDEDYLAEISKGFRQKPRLFVEFDNSLKTKETSKWKILTSICPKIEIDTTTTEVSKKIKKKYPLISYFASPSQALINELCTYITLKEKA
jgi:hypothetical protein